MTTNANVLEHSAAPPKSNGTGPTMKALVYLGNGKKAFESHPKP